MAGTARLLALVTVALTACGGGGSFGPQSSPAGPAASPQTLALQLDGRADAFDGAFLGYFPNSVSVHPEER